MQRAKGASSCPLRHPTAEDALKRGRESFVSSETHNQQWFARCSTRAAAPRSLHSEAFLSSMNIAVFDGFCRYWLPDSQR